MRDRPNDTIHRTNAGRTLGRPLKPTEDAHHLDGDKLANQPANLRPMDHAAHSRLSAKERSLNQLRKSLRMVKDRKRLY